MSKTYRTKRPEANDAAGRMQLPAEATVALGEVAASAKEDLLALAVGAGLQVMHAIMDEDVAALAGPEGKHDRDRSAVRRGTGRGSVTLGERRVPAAGAGGLRLGRPTGRARWLCPRTSCLVAPR